MKGSWTPSEGGAMRSERASEFLAGAFLIVGSAVFLWGGALHPATGPELGPLGTETYFRNFARHVVEHAAWQNIHTGILAGPILWALGIWGVRKWLPAEKDSVLLSMGLAAILLGSAGWSVTFVIDGFVAPVQAGAVVVAGPQQGSALTGFMALQEFVIRLGLVSWLLLSVGLAALGATILACDTIARSFRYLLGVVGVALGLWSVVAWVVGIFRPGPFVSGAWVPTAVATALWFSVLGLAIVRPAA